MIVGAVGINKYLLIVCIAVSQVAWPASQVPCDKRASENVLDSPRPKRLQIKSPVTTSGTIRLPLTARVDDGKRTGEMDEASVRQDYLYRLLSSDLEVFVMGIDNKFYRATEVERCKALDKLHQIPGIDFMTRPRVSLSGDFELIELHKALILNVLLDDQKKVIGRLKYKDSIYGISKYKKILVDGQGSNIMLWNNNTQILAHTSNDIL